MTVHLFLFPGLQSAPLRAVGAAPIREYRVPVAHLLLLPGHQREVRGKRRGGGELRRGAGKRETDMSNNNV